MCPLGSWTCCAFPWPLTVTLAPPSPSQDLLLCILPGPTLHLSPWVPVTFAPSPLPPLLPPPPSQDMYIISGSMLHVLSCITHVFKNGTRVPRDRANQLRVMRVESTDRHKVCVWWCGEHHPTQGVWRGGVLCLCA